MSDLTREEVEAMLAAANAAAPGPWEVEHRGILGGGYYGSILSQPSEHGTRLVLANDVVNQETAAFIAFARAALPALAESWLAQEQIVGVARELDTIWQGPGFGKETVGKILSLQNRLHRALKEAPHERPDASHA